MAEAITKSQIKSIYTLGASLGLVEHGSRSHDDMLHQLVGAVAGKASVSRLTGTEASRVISELMLRMRGMPEAPAAPKKAPKKYTETPGGMTAGQQKKAWKLMYELRGWDSEPNETPVGQRISGIIRRQFRVDAPLKDPFHFLSWEDGRRLIEILKKYCQSAELRQIRAGGAR